MIKRNIFSLATALLILILSLTGPSAFSRLELPALPGLDKIVHTLMYLALTFVLIAENRKLLNRPVNYLVIAIIPFLFGIIIEIMQILLTRYRQGDVLDILANLTGIGFALLLWLLLKELLVKIFK